MLDRTPPSSASEPAARNATVKTHVNRIFHNTGARDRAQAVRYADQHGLARRP
jgi:DNA-binding NarL/FixJ family response regulator